MIFFFFFRRRIRISCTFYIIFFLAAQYSVMSSAGFEKCSDEFIEWPALIAQQELNREVIDREVDVLISSEFYLFIFDGDRSFIFCCIILYRSASSTF